MHATARDVSSTMATAMLLGLITHRDAPAWREILALPCNIRARPMKTADKAAADQRRRLQCYCGSGGALAVVRDK